MASVSACWDREELLSAYLDGQLDAAELDAVVAHLESCAGCIAEFHRLKQVRTALRLLPVQEPPPGVVPGLHPSDALSAFLDGELVTAETAAITAHVAGCVECRSELHDLDAARTAVRALPRLEVPITTIPATRPRSAHRTRKLAVATAAAAAVVAAVVLAGGHGGAQVDRDSLATRHSARTSVESGFSVLPALLSPHGTP